MSITDLKNHFSQNSDYLKSRINQSSQVSH